MGETWNAWIAALGMDLTSHALQRKNGVTPSEAEEYERRLWNYALHLFRRPAWDVLTKLTVFDLILPTLIVSIRPFLVNCAQSVSGILILGSFGSKIALN
jgi:hypothetical protein